MNRSLRHVVTLLLGVIALVGPVIAEDAFPLRAIEFEGNQHFSSEALAELSGLEIGTAVREGNFKTALRHLNNTGVFERLEFKYAPLGDGYRVTFVVEEVLELFLVRFDGFDAGTEEIQELLAQKVPLFGDRVPPTGPMVSMIGNALQTWWTQQGNDSKIEGRLVPTGDNEFEMLFGPRQKTMNIAFVRFENSGELDCDSISPSLFSYAGLLADARLVPHPNTVSVLYVAEALPFLGNRLQRSRGRISLFPSHRQLRFELEQSFWVASFRGKHQVFTLGVFLQHSHQTFFF